MRLSERMSLWTTWTRQWGTRKEDHGSLGVFDCSWQICEPAWKCLWRCPSELRGLWRGWGLLSWKQTSGNSNLALTLVRSHGSSQVAKAVMQPLFNFLPANGLQLWPWGQGALMPLTCHHHSTSTLWTRVSFFSQHLRSLKKNISSIWAPCQQLVKTALLTAFYPVI